ncbi:hypothetical protein D3C78_1671850 [compost metagenome]
MIGVDHIEITDGVLIIFQHVLPATACPCLLFDVKLQHPQVAFARHVLKLFAVPQRPFQQGIQLAAIR